jgi:hypothetical protein
VFEVRLYPTEQSIPNLLRNAVPDSDTPMQQIITGANYSVDTRKLRHQMAKIDYTKVRRRRRQYVRLFNEAKMSQDPRDPRGVSFTAMLLMLAHYTLIDDEKALRVDELLVRRAKVERVEDLVNLDRVRGLLRTIYWRRRFLRVHDEKRMLEAHNTGTIPAIVLDGTEAVVGFDKNGDPLQGYTASTPSILATVPEQTPPPAYPYDTPPRVNTSGLVNPFDVSVSAASSNASYNTALSPTGERARRSIDSRTSSEVSPSLR